ncbi:MAG TPA: helix-turn-helix domain-containing protein [Kofleriaceae bacterium]|nr:helix-turn-helix domain-containing protein [Kofleriaceae bacterium]
MSGNGVLAVRRDREPARRDQHAEDTRRAILAAARQAFARDGYAGTALEAIVGPARLTKGALYHHFKNKAAVLEAVYIEMEEELAARVTAAVRSASGGAWDRLIAAVDAFFAASAEPEYARIVLRDAPLVLGPVQGREIDHAIGLGLVVQLVTALSSEGLLRPLPVVATARILLAAASEVAIAMAYADDPALVRREGTEVLLAMLDGLRAR